MGSSEAYDAAAYDDVYLLCVKKELVALASDNRLSSCKCAQSGERMGHNTGSCRYVYAYLFRQDAFVDETPFVCGSGSVRGVFRFIRSLYPGRAGARGQ